MDLKRLQTAIKFCKTLGFHVDGYPIVVTEFLGDGVLGRAVAGTIYLSKRVFEQGTKMVAGTVLEEYLHLKFGVKDCTRQMQNMLVDAIISVGERVTRKPL